VLSVGLLNTMFRNLDVENVEITRKKEVASTESTLGLNLGSEAFLQAMEQTDLFELWPSDGYVNNLRGNLPLGYVKEGTVTFTSTNGCKIGTCKTDESQG